MGFVFLYVEIYVLVLMKIIHETFKHTTWPLDMLVFYFGELIRHDTFESILEKTDRRKTIHESGKKGGRVNVHI